MVRTITKTEQEWKQQLSKEQYHVLRLKGTERAFTGKYWNYFEPGTYVCAGCKTPLFASKTKFESECGWPSFFSPMFEENIETKTDTSYGMRRTEVM